MEVDSSSGDNLFKPELPEKQVKVKSRTAKAAPKTTTTTLAARADPATYDGDIMGDGPIMLGDSTLLRQWLETMGPTIVRSGKYEGDIYETIYTKGRHYANCLGRCLKLDADESRSYNLVPSVKVYIAYSIIKSA
eukprot:1081491-Pyramimonas_sp.AAC.1